SMASPSIRSPSQINDAMGRLSVSNRLLTSNIYKTRTHTNEVFRYSVTVEKAFTKNNNQSVHVEISRSGGQDATRVPRSRICKAVMQLLSSEPSLSDFFFLYEGCEVMLSNAELTEFAVKKKIDPAHLKISDEDRRMHLKDADYIEIKIAPDGGLVDITAAVQASTEEDPHLATFYAMISRAFAPTGTFVGFRGGRLFDQRTLEDIKFGHQRCTGIVAGVRTIGDANKKFMAIDIDVTQGTFYKPQPVIASICERFGIRNLDSLKERYGNTDAMRTYEIYVRDMVVTVEESDRVFTICGLKWGEDNEGKRRVLLWQDVCDSAAQVGKYEGSLVVVEEMKMKDGRIVTHNHPLAALHVLPHTRVPKEKQEAEKPRPIDPDTRFRAINKARSDIGIDHQNEILKGFATEICPVPEKVPYVRLEAPEMFAARSERGREGEKKRLAVDEEKRKWNSSSDRFVKPVSIAYLNIFCDMQSFGNNNPAQIDMAYNFCSWYIDACKMKGIEISGEDKSLVNGLTNLEHKMSDFKKERDFETARRPDGVAPLIFMLYLGDRGHHDDLKLLERRYEILTQHVEPATVIKIMKKGKGPRDYTLHNIVQKTNEKCGGRNVEVVGKESTVLAAASNGKNAPATLVIGVDVAHPPPMNRYQKMRGMEPDPSMIGISSNALSANPMSFCGDYVPTVGRREYVPDDIMEKQGKYLVEMFYKNHHGRLPERIIYYRDGVDKGQYPRVTDEFDALMDGAKQFVNSLVPPRSSPFAPRETVVVCTKRHNARLFDVQRDRAYNPKAGTIVDTIIVSPYSPEFYLQAATAIIGTAKPLMCTVLKDGDREMMMYPREDLKELETLTHNLCYTHEICDSPVSLPEPVYNAHENAKRGMNNLKTDRQAINQRLSLDEINERLSTRGTLLEGIKYNA
ncbi:hypothetical protein PFISCL1PPCAC_18747, partial [Pristionchus fissidentatus]